MRSLKECYEVAKRFHHYWVGGNHSQFMCHAAIDAHQHGMLTEAESVAVREDAHFLVQSINSNTNSLAYALYGINVSHEGVKAFWDKYIDSLENQKEETQYA